MRYEDTKTAKQNRIMIWVTFGMLQLTALVTLGWVLLS